MIFKVPSQESKHGPAPQYVSWQRGKTGFYEGNSGSREPAWTMAHLSSRGCGVGLIRNPAPRQQVSSTSGVSFSGSYGKVSTWTPDFFFGPGAKTEAGDSTAALGGTEGTGTCTVPRQLLTSPPPPGWGAWAKATSSMGPPQHNHPKQSHCPWCLGSPLNSKGGC